MLDSKKMAAVSGILGGLALLGAGVAQAQGPAAENGCQQDSTATSCVYRSEHRYATPDGGYVLEQSQDCTVYQDNRMSPTPAEGTRQGATVNCSNSAP